MSQEETTYMFSEQGSFELKNGTRITVPSWASGSGFRSKNASEFPGTPIVMPIIQTGGGRFTFCERRRHSKPKEVGRHLFVPQGVKPGDTLEIEWAEGRSACAKLVTG